MKIFKVAIYLRLSKEEYKDFSLSYNEKIQEIKDLLHNFEVKLETIKSKISDKQLRLEYFKTNKNIKSLNRELVVNLIDDIKVYNNKTIEINFKYYNEYKNLLSYLENIDDLEIVCNG